LTASLIRRDTVRARGVNGGLRKVTEYARLGIPQYWVVEHSPRLAVQVLTLANGTYTAAPAVAEGTVLEAVLDADKPITVSFDPAELLDF
jgi:hypothetical protein